MKERPIIYTTESVRAILDGRKTQTRRVIIPQPIHLDTNVPGESWFWSRHCDTFGDTAAEWRELLDKGIAHSLWAAAYSPQSLARHCPYGIPGDRLWVRETWATWARYDDLPPSQISRHAGLWWKAGGGFDITGERHGRWRSARFMPLWVSRLTQTITGIRVEQVQDISSEDIHAEGLIADSCMDACWWFEHHWDSINAKRGYSWAANPWVWVLDTEVAE